MIKSLPPEENPREKAIALGIGALSNTELLALCLHTGSRHESVMTLATRLLSEIDGLQGLKHVTYHKLISIKGIKKAKAVELLAIVELAKRLNVPIKPGIKLNTPRDIYEYMKDMSDFKQEHFEILILDYKHRLLARKLMFIGPNNATTISVREIFEEVLAHNGSAMIAVHNHPSGEALPSLDDEIATSHLMEAGEVMGIDVLDHLIIGAHQYYSMKAETLYNAHDK